MSIQYTPANQQAFDLVDILTKVNPEITKETATYFHGATKTRQGTLDA